MESNNSNSNSNSSTNNNNNNDNDNNNDHNAIWRAGRDGDRGRNRDDDAGGFFKRPCAHDAARTVLAPMLSFSHTDMTLHRLHS